MRERLVVIGGGAAGMNAARREQVKYKNGQRRIREYEVVAASGAPRLRGSAKENGGGAQKAEGPAP